MNGKLYKFRCIQIYSLFIFLTRTFSSPSSSSSCIFFFLSLMSSSSPFSYSSSFLSQFTIRAKHFTWKSQPPLSSATDLPPRGRHFPLGFLQRPLSPLPAVPLPSYPPSCSEFPPHRAPFPLTHRLWIFLFTDWLSTYFPLRLSPLDYLWEKKSIRKGTERESESVREKSRRFSSILFLFSFFFFARYQCLPWGFVRGERMKERIVEGKREREGERKSKLRKGEPRPPVTCI